MTHDRPDLPIDRLRAALPPDHDAHARVDALDRELQAEKPSTSAIKEHVAELRKHAPIAAIITNWFDDPRTQTFIDELVRIGL